MKSIILVAAVLTTFVACGQNKSKRPSPPVVVKETINSGASITIDYSQPSVKGRTIGKDIEPKNGQIWRAGANEATTFDVSKNIKVEGQPLAAGKYAFFTLWNADDTWTLIFNKVHKTWGAYDYEKNKEQDALKINVNPAKAPVFSEKLTYAISKEGKISLLWGDVEVDFSIE